MPPNLAADDRLPRRNARSFDLEEEESASKAAAWVWHLHESKAAGVTEGRFLTLQARRRSSGSSDKKMSRFRHEAVTDSIRLRGPDVPMWDCGSSLYDTFELVAFGNWLDRRMIKGVTLTSSTARAAVAPPPTNETAASREPHESEAAAWHQPSQIPRTCSMPNSLQAARAQRKHTTDGFMPGMNGDCMVSFSQSEAQEETSSKRWWSVNRLSKAFKKLGHLHSPVSGNAGCRQNVDIVQPSRTKLLQFQAQVPAGWCGPRHDCRREDLRLFKGRQGFQNTGSTSLRYGLLRRVHGGNHISANGFTKPNAGKLEHTIKAIQIPPQNYHRHFHHHHHHLHHHHHRHHTMPSESAQSAPK